MTRIAGSIHIEPFFEEEVKGKEQLTGIPGIAVQSKDCFADLRPVFLSIGLAQVRTERSVSFT